MGVVAGPVSGAGDDLLVPDLHVVEGDAACGGCKACGGDRVFDVGVLLEPVGGVAGWGFSVEGDDVEVLYGFVGVAVLGHGCWPCVWVGVKPVCLMVPLGWMVIVYDPPGPGAVRVRGRL